MNYINEFVQNYVIVGWLLPFLCMLLFQLRFWQWIDDGSTMKELWEYHNEGGRLFYIIMTFSVMWPFGVIFYICLFVYFGYTFYLKDRMKKYIPKIKFNYKKVLYDLFFGEIKWRG